MSLHSILKKKIEEIQPNPQVVKDLKKLSDEFISDLKSELIKAKYNAQVAVGGSFAKGTLVKKDKHDVDIFVRFDWRYEEISDMLEKVLKKVCRRQKMRIERVHGSRDYFKCYPEGDKYYLELIPVTWIKKVSEERNVTDLSYFHTNYVKRRIKGMEKDVMLAKIFCEAQRVYGAESYVRGFSGYALEILILRYGSFVKMLRELVKVKNGERLVIDFEKFYKRKNDVFFEINENRLHSPVILVDPTYKERNALAALSWETFERFQKAARAFLKNPSEKYFIEKPIDKEKLKKIAKRRKGEFIQLRLMTDRQEGDIAGTKLKKFADFICLELNKYFVLHEKEFEYDEKQSADLYLVAKSKKEIIHIGPPSDKGKHMKKHVRAFKEEHPKAYEVKKFWQVDLKIDFNLDEFFKKWVSKNKDKLKEMSITGIKSV